LGCRRTFAPGAKGSLNGTRHVCGLTPGVRSRTEWNSPLSAENPGFADPAPASLGFSCLRGAATTNCEPGLALSRLGPSAQKMPLWPSGAVRSDQGSGPPGAPLQSCPSSGSGRGLLPPLPWRRVSVLVTGSGTATTEAAVTRPTARRVEHAVVMVDVPRFAGVDLLAAAEAADETSVDLGCGTASVIAVAPRRSIADRSVETRPATSRKRMRRRGTTSPDPKRQYLTAMLARDRACARLERWRPHGSTPP
jgi:hypothetical protein